MKLVSSLNFRDNKSDFRDNKSDFLDNASDERLRKLSTVKSYKNRVSPPPSRLVGLILYVRRFDRYLMMLCG